MTVFALEVENFVAELDHAIEAHLAWTRRVLRCAVLQAPPGDDVLAADAHCRCRFGRWFAGHREAFEQIDAAATTRVVEQHERMHDAVRALCTDVLADRRGRSEDLDAFEACQSALVAELARLKTEVLARSARRDPLTGLPLRYGLEEEFGRCRALARRSTQKLVLMLADVDRFKLVNDVHGHAAGDQALRHVAGILRAQARADEPVFRFGGEEFLVIFHAVDEAAAGRAADRLLQALREAPLALSDGTVLQLRVSAGLAAVAPDESLGSAVERADAALYAAKNGGRDRWCWSEA
jgi:diguanylate cyclase (GGDEF)-like protein